MSYWGTSTLVKLYAKEPDSAVFENYLQSAESSPTTSSISLYEARASFRRKEAEGILLAGKARVLYEQLWQNFATGEIKLIKLDADLEREYGQVLNFCFTLNPRIPIRTLDAIHLASARTAVELEIVTTDKRMREAARQLGFAVFPHS
jgi:predicted nucleic acid-binding protein